MRAGSGPSSSATGSPAPSSVASPSEDSTPSASPSASTSSSLSAASRRPPLRRLPSRPLPVPPFRRRRIRSRARLPGSASLRPLRAAGGSGHRRSRLPAVPPARARLRRRNGFGNRDRLERRHRLRHARLRCLPPRPLRRRLGSGAPSDSNSSDARPRLFGQRLGLSHPALPLRRAACTWPAIRPAARRNRPAPGRR